MRKIRGVIAGLLSFTIAWTSIFPAYAAPAVSEADIYRRYPDARVIHVSQQEYPALASRLARSGYSPAGERVALNGPMDLRGSPDPEPNTSRDSGDCAETSSERRTGDASMRVTVDATGEVLTSHRSGGGNDSVVLFVIIGTVVLVVWALYAFKYLFDVAAGRRACGAWSDFGFSSGWATGEREAYARFSGLRYRTGFRKGSTDVGIGAEIGRSRIELPEDSLDIEGAYWLLGPLLRWQLGGGRNPSYFQMEFLAGSTENDEVGVIAQAKTGLSFGVGDNLRLGVNAGALNINLHETQGIVRDSSQYHYLFGVDMGYRF